MNLTSQWLAQSRVGLAIGEEAIGVRGGVITFEDHPGATTLLHYCCHSPWADWPLQPMS